jgi:hypothetical protein
MVNMSDLSGYLASALVLLTFMSKDMRLLRIIAIFSNIAFITYGLLDWLPPVLILHTLLLPLNIVRLIELQSGPCDSRPSFLTSLRNLTFPRGRKPIDARSPTTKPRAPLERPALTGTSL